LVVELGCWISFLGLFGFELNVLVLGRFVVVLWREREISLGGEELCRCGADSEAVKINCLSRYKPIYIGHVGLD
jgi:hypothetical protein